MNTRAYFDWNATAPLKAEARTAMISVMSNLGNPSSIHTQGRAAKAIIDTATSLCLKVGIIVQRTIGLIMVEE